jgi:hypothetical protein
MAKYPSKFVVVVVVVVMMMMMMMMILPLAVNCRGRAFFCFLAASKSEQKNLCVIF